MKVEEKRLEPLTLFDAVPPVADPMPGRGLVQ